MDPDPALDLDPDPALDLDPDRQALDPAKMIPIRPIRIRIQNTGSIASFVEFS
jgi:hypothetical protein